jgi:hypothetical protein
MDCATLSFSPRTPKPASHGPWLYNPTNPTQDELIYSSLDLSFQVNVAVSRVDREIIDTITRDRIRRIFH